MIFVLFFGISHSYKQHVKDKKSSVDGYQL